MDLRALRPLRIGFRHRLVSIAIEILRALGLNVGVRSRRIPHAAEVTAALDDGHPVSTLRKRLASGEAGYTGANNANVLLLDHEYAPVN
jgi:hypothetical protein